MLYQLSYTSMIRFSEVSPAPAFSPAAPDRRPVAVQGCLSAALPKIVHEQNFVRNSIHHRLQHTAIDQKYMIGVSQGDRLTGERLIADNNAGISPIVLNCADNFLHGVDTDWRRMAFALNHGNFAVAIQHQIGAIVVGSRRLEYRNTPLFEKAWTIYSNSKPLF